jgi:hypothetical protein
MPIKRRLAGALLTSSVLFLCLLFANQVEAGSPKGDPGATQTCVVCHATPGLKMQLASGEILSAQIPPEVFERSVHGNLLQCTACHTNIPIYPHPARDIARPSARDIPFLVRGYTNCGGCHKQEYTQYLGSAHARALTTGRSDSAVCTDCHGVHDIEPAKPSNIGLALAPAVYNCGKCHKEEFEQYKNSAHGKDLLEKGDSNVPSCVDCHGVHDIHQAKDAADFRSQSIALCSSCHADAKLMQKYGLSTDILSTYVADFHGTTAMLFPSKTGHAPDQAMCYDCHGVHDIQSTVSASGLTLQDNLLTMCQKCHANAGANFPAAWLGHYQPTPDRSALVFWIRAIYNVLVAGVVLLLVGHVTLDIGRVLLNTLRGGHPADE